MTSSLIANLEKLLDGPRDGALLRYSLGCEYLKTGQADEATERFREALARDARFSAAWKLLGKALDKKGETEAALEAYAQGIRVAEAKGDRQAAKEMGVFSRRLIKQRDKNNT